MEKGLIQVYTGNGKGETTATLGLALRALGHGMKVLIIQFMKEKSGDSEEKAARRFSPNLTIISAGREGSVSKSDPEPAEVSSAQEGFLIAKRAVEGKEYDVIILNGINTAIDDGLLSLPDLLHLIDSKPSTIELILTGRNASPEVLDRADLVTEMVERKHHCTKGISARKRNKK